MNRRRIKFCYYTAARLVKKGNKWVEDGYFDLAEWIRSYEEGGQLLDTIRIDDFTARVERHEHDEASDTHLIEFVYMREDNIPVIAPDGSSEEEIELEEEEYIGENKYILYDSKAHIVMSQVNRMSLSESKMVALINDTVKRADTRLYLRPVIYNIPRDRLARGQVRSIHISVDVLQDESQCKNASLREMIRAAKSFSSQTLTLKLGVGKGKKNAQLTPGEAGTMIEDIVNHNIVASTARITFRDENVKSPTVYDLIDNLANSVITFYIAPRTRLGPDLAFAEMRREYGTMREGLYQALGN